MYRSVVGLLVFCIYSTAGFAEEAGFRASKDSAFAPAWQPLRLGAGGQITAIYNYSDGTTLIRTDTYGGYLYVPTGSCTYGATVYAGPCWQQLITATSIPSLTIDMANGSGGAAELVACPSSTNVLYLIWENSLYVSINKGMNWVKTSQISKQNPNDGNGRGPFVACDPNNPDIVYVGTPSSGVFKTTNGTAGAAGGTSTATFSQVTAVGASADGRNHVVAFQLGSSSHILVGTYGAGIYESTDRGVTWNLISGSSRTFSHIVSDKFDQYWITDNGGNNLYKYASATWSTIKPGGGVASVAVDPNSAAVETNYVAVTDFNGQPNISSNNGGTWTGQFTNQTFVASSSQPAWLGVANQARGGGGVNLNGYSSTFDASSNLWFAGGIGVWKTLAPIKPNATVWTANSLGIEQLVTVQIISPLGGSPIAAVWDRGFFLLKNPDVFPSNYWNSRSSLNPIMGGWNIDWAGSNSNFLTGWETSNISSSESPASSTDGGNSFTLWGAIPAHPGAQGGNIAALTEQKWILISSVGQPITVTTDGGRTWNKSNIPAAPTNWVTGVGVGQALAADRVAHNTYCAVTTGRTFYSSTNSGLSFTPTGASSVNVDGFPNQFFLLSVPGQAGNFFYTAGGQGGSHPTNTHLWKSSDTCVTWKSVNSNLKEVIAVGFGAVPPSGGNGYPTIYAYGWYNKVLGFYQSIDGGTTWRSISIPASQTPWPLNIADLVTWLTGDPNVYGRIYVGFRGAGAAYIDTADACPWVNFSSINPNASFTGTVTLTAQHSGLVPVSNVQFSVDGSNIGSPLTGPDPYSISWITGSVAAGSHTLRVAATGAKCTGSFSIPVFTH